MCVIDIASRNDFLYFLEKDYLISEQYGMGNMNCIK